MGLHGTDGGGLNVVPAGDIVGINLVIGERAGILYLGPDAGIQIWIEDS